MAENDTGSNDRRQNLRSNFINECRDNRIIIQAELSQRLRRVFRRNFDGFSRSAYLIRYYSQYARENEVEELIVNEIMALMTDAKEEFNKKIAVANQILSDNLVVEKAPQFEKYNVTIIDPLANFYLQTFSVAQNLENKLGALWLSTIIDQKQHKQALEEIAAMLRSIHTKSRALSLGLRNRARPQMPNNQNNALPDLDIIDDSLDANQSDPGTEERITTVSTKKIKKVNNASLSIELAQPVDAEVAEDIT